MTVPGPIVGLIFLFDAMLIIVVAILVLRKDSENLLNQVVAVAMVAFGFYLLFVGLIFTLPPSDLLLFNLFRDIAVSGAITASILGALSGIILLRGEHYAARIRVIVPFVALEIIAVALTIPNEYVSYDMATDTIGFVGTISGAIWAGIGLFLIPVSMMALATFCYLQTLRGIDRSHPKFKKALALPIALILVTVGIAYYTVIAVMGFPVLILSYLGHAFYITSSVFFFYAFR
jgi:hypothetical protein